MAYLPSLLANVPDESKPVAALAIGAIVLVSLVLLHGSGIHFVLVFHTRRLRRLRKGRPHLVAAVLLFGVAVFLMLALHVVEFAMWAYILLLLGIVPRAYNAVYFSANAYTTLGFGNVDLSEHWRIIAPIIGISGLFTFAWTTSALANVVTAHRELMDLLEDEREKEFELRSTLRKEIWNTLEKERAAEHSEESATKADAAGASFFQRLLIRRGVRKRVKELRAAKVADILELRRREHEEEQQLGPGDATQKANDNK